MVANDSRAIAALCPTCEVCRSRRVTYYSKGIIRKRTNDLTVGLRKLHYFIMEKANGRSDKIVTGELS